jgi:hypothetical protein
MSSWSKKNRQKGSLRGYHKLVTRSDLEGNSRHELMMTSTFASRHIGVAVQLPAVGKTLCPPHILPIDKSIRWGWEEPVTTTSTSTVRPSKDKIVEPFDISRSRPVKAEFPSHFEFRNSVDRLDKATS